MWLRTLGASSTPWRRNAVSETRAGAHYFLRLDNCLCSRPDTVFGQHQPARIFISRFVRLGAVPSLPRLRLLLILFGSIVCVALPVFCQEPPPANPACANGGNIRCNCLPCSAPRRPPPTYTPPAPTAQSPPSGPSPEELERAREELVAERARVAAEEKRKQQEFEKEKAEALQSLKGVSSDDLGLKGVDTDDSGLKGVGNDDLGLKGVDETGTRSAAPAPTEKCEQRAEAAATYAELKPRVLTDEQVIRSFGFSQRGEDILAWGELGEDARSRYANQREGILASVALDEITGVLKAGVSAAPAITPEFSERLIAVLEAAGIPEDNASYIIARQVGGTITPGEAEILTRNLDHVKNMYTAAKGAEGVVNPRGSLDLAGSIISLAGLFNEEIALLSKDVDTISLAVYATEYGVAKHQISKLTTLTEDQLKELNDYIGRLKADTAQLHNAEQLLSSLPSCGSTGFVSK